MVKKSVKRKHAEMAAGSKEDANCVVLPAKRSSDEPLQRKKKWTNKQRVLVFSSRGITYRDRHLMEDLKKMMPHHKPESKMEKAKSLVVINEICEMKHCNKAMLLEAKGKKDLYMWLSNVPNGPSVRFLVQNIYTMDELKLTGNCLRGSRPLLSFDPTFLEKPHYQLVKELLTQVFGVPNHHPKSQPFFDHVFTFTILDNRIWFRNFQILNDEGALAEVGPRFVLNPIKIFSGSFGGTALWENGQYISPNKYRRQVNLEAKGKYVNRIEQKLHYETTKPKESYKLTPLEEIFKGDPYEKAKELQHKQNELVKNTNGKQKSTEKVAKKKKQIVQEEEQDTNWEVEDNENSDEISNGVTDDEVEINIPNVVKALKQVKSKLEGNTAKITKTVNKNKLKKPVTKKSVGKVTKLVTRKSKFLQKSKKKSSKA